MKTSQIVSLSVSDELTQCLFALEQREAEKWCVSSAMLPFRQKKQKPFIARLLVVASLGCLHVSHPLVCQFRLPGNHLSFKMLNFYTKDLVLHYIHTFIPNPNTVSDMVLAHSSVTIRWVVLWILS